MSFDNLDSDIINDIINDVINVKNFYVGENDTDTIIKLNNESSSNLVLEINENNDLHYEWKPEIDINESNESNVNNQNIDIKHPMKNYVIIYSDTEDSEDDFNNFNTLNDLSEDELNKNFYDLSPPPINYQHIKKGIHINNSSNLTNNENVLKSYKMLKKDLDNDINMFNDLISNQTYYKITLFKRVLTSYLSIFKNNNDTEFHPKVIYAIKHMGNMLDLYNSISSILCEVLFTKNINKENEIDKYINFIKPFLDTHQLQENLLNQILILINNYDKLFDEKEILNIFHLILKKNIISINILYKWYHKLDDDHFELHNKLNIKYDIPKAVYIFLENMITQLFENENDGDEDDDDEDDYDGSI